MRAGTAAPGFARSGNLFAIFIAFFVLFGFEMWGRRRFPHTASISVPLAAEHGGKRINKKSRWKEQQPLPVRGF